MLKLMIGLTRALLLALWAACILSLLSLIPEPYGQPVLMFGAVVLLLHFVEYLLVRSKVAALALLSTTSSAAENRTFSSKR
jgi:uncharacterized protein YhhL (DUF1145 family)